MIWHGEFVVTTQTILTGIYQNDKELFDKDFKFAKQAFKQLRIDEIRNYKDKKKLHELDNQQGMFHEIDEKYHATWKKYFRDQDIYEEIEKDVRRTRSETKYFTKAVDQSNLSE